MDSIKLKPCPFCGKEPERIDIDPTDEHEQNAGGSYIACPNCYASSKVVFGDKTGLEESWNARALLTADPAPCENVRDLARAVLLKYKHSAVYDSVNAAVDIDAYATRREQEAREDERRRDIAAAKSLKIPVIPGRQEPNKDKYNDVIDDAIRAILQGAEPAKEKPRATLLCNTCKNTYICCAEKKKASKTGKCWKYEKSEPADPAKVSEDVERDILTIDRCIRYPDHFPGIAIKASAALDRLVSRIKDGKRG